DRLGEDRLPRAGRADQEASLRRLDRDLPVPVRLQERVLDRLAQLAHLALETADVIEGDRGLLDDLRTGDDRIEGRRKDAHHRERLLVQRDARTNDQVLLRDVIRRVHDEIRTGGRLDDDAAIGQDVPDVSDDEGRT